MRCFEPGVTLSAVILLNIDPFVEKRIISAVDANLESMGFRLAGTGTPDFLVNFVTTTQEKIDFDTYYSGWGYYGWYGGTSVQARQWTEGTLVVDFVDFNTKQLSWRGWAQGAIEPNISPEERTRRINEVVAGIMRQFPPKS
jgi:hypothetical protein